MSPVKVVGRLSPLAAALGVGAVLAVAGAAPATADAAVERSSSPADSGGHRPSRVLHPTAANLFSRRGIGLPTAGAPTARVLANGPTSEEGVRAAYPSALASRSLLPAGRRVGAPSLLAAERRFAPSVAPVDAGPSAAVTEFATPPRASASGAGIFSNQSPTLRPVQTGQLAGGVVHGNLNAVDPDSAVLTYRVTGAPAHGSVSVDAAGAYIYTADAAVAATGITDSFRVTVSDAGNGFHLHGLMGLINLLTFGLIGSSGHTRTATVGVTVTPFGGANRAPTGIASVGAPDPATGVVTGAVIGSDADGDPLTYTGSSTTPKGAVVVTLGGGFTYTPTDAARLSAASPRSSDDLQDGFTVTVSDGRGGTVDVDVTVPVSPVSDVTAPLAAFPGAEGFGAYATGGRGGSVIYVTNLNAAGPGSLQWAIDQPGARYILFKVSGVIDTQIHLTNGDVTIAGQTSPGGITIRGLVTDETPYQDQAVQAPVDFAENWILQHIRLRPGLGGPSDDGLRIRYTRNGIVDHVSIGNATDEAIEISYSHDITVQNTLIAETVGVHSFYGGVLMNYSNPAYGFGLDNVSLHHNVFNRIEGRLPEGSRESLAAANSYMNFEMSNNLYWDPNFFVALGLTTNSLTDSHGNPYPIYWNLNAVNNFFRTRAGFPYGMFDDQITRTPLNRLYVSGNKMSAYPGLSDYQLFYCCNDFTAEGANTGAQVAQKLLSRNPFPSITYTRTDALVNALLNTAGAWPRDAMDIRLMRSVATDTIATAPRNTNPAGDALTPIGSPPAAPTDTDNDGMPDAWEVTKGLNPNVANTNGHTLSSIGYTDLEVYLQELSASRVTGWVG